MLKIVLTSFIFSILAELALDTILLLRQLVFYTSTLFRTLNIHCHYGRVVIALDFGSDDLTSFSVTDIVLIIIFICYSILIFHK